MEYVITFKNTNHAIKGERLLLDDNVKVNVMPLPSQIRAGCGICLRVSENDIPEAEQFLKDKDIDFETYIHENQNYEKVNRGE